MAVNGGIQYNQEELRKNENKIVGNLKKINKIGNCSN